MKKRLAVILLFIGTLFYGCKKEDRQVTNLKVFVQESTGTGIGALSGAEVKIYTSFEDLRYDIHVAGTGQTDASGVAFFAGVLPVKHYVSVEKECLKSRYGNYLTTSPPMIPGQTTTIPIWLHKQGFVELKNNSTEPYHYTINHSFKQTLDASGSDIRLMDEGINSISYNPISDSTLLTTANINIICGDTILYNIP